MENGTGSSADAPKVLVTWSSRTGNTEKIARAVHSGAPGSVLARADEAGPVEGFGLYAVGFWVDKGQVDEASREVLARLRLQAAAAGKPPRVALFGTMGADPSSPRGRECVARLAGREGGGLDVVDVRLWQGKVDPRVIERMNRASPMTPERQAWIQAAEAHPDSADCAEARRWMEDLLRRLGG